MGLSRNMERFCNGVLIERGSHHRERFTSIERDKGSREREKESLDGERFFTLE